MLVNCVPFLQLMILSLFKGMGASLLSVGTVKSLLLELMEKYSQHDSGSHSLQKKFSKNEIKLLCLLLEVSSLFLFGISSVFTFRSFCYFSINLS